MPVVIRGMRELQRAFVLADRGLQIYTRGEFRHVAEPIRADAASLAESKIRNMPSSPAWAGMRVGVTRSVVYVAPKKRGVKRTGDVMKKRRNLAGLIAGRALEPALHAHEAQVVNRVDHALDRICDRFNGGL